MNEETMKIEKIQHAADELRKAIEATGYEKVFVSWATCKEKENDQFLTVSGYSISRDIAIADLSQILFQLSGTIWNNGQKEGMIIKE